MPTRALLVLASLALGRLAFGVQMQSVATLEPLLVRTFHLDYAALGTLIGVYMAPGLIAALPAGLLARRFGDRVVVGTGLVLMTLGPSLPLLWPSTAGIDAGRLVAGLGAVTVVVLQSKIVADWFSGSRFLAALTVSTAAYPVGVGGSELVLPRLAERFGWQGAIATGAIIAGLGAALFLAVERPAPGHTATRRFALPTGRECWLATLAGMIWTTYNAGYIGFLSYVPAWLAEHHASGEAGLVMTLATWTNVPAMFLGAALAGRVGRAPVFAAAAVILAAATAGITAGGPAVVWATVFGLFGAMHPSIIIAAGTESARPEHRAVGMGLFYATYYLGGAVMPGALGHAADAVGSAGGALVTAAAVSLLSIPLFFAHRRMLHRTPVLASAPAPTG